jgi:hypothetical protein
MSDLINTYTVKVDNVQLSDGKSIDVSTLAPGYYIVRIHGAKYVTSASFVKE